MAIRGGLTLRNGHIPAAPWRSVDDVLVVGAGAVGTSVAFHLAQQGVRVRVLEKEAAPGRHQSGRNSGVLHPGHNLVPGSRKARFCVEGHRRLRAYCREHDVALEEGGILVVAQDEAEQATLRELERRARANGVRASLVDAQGVQELEPHARGVAALHAPEGASFDAPAYVRCLAQDAGRQGAAFSYGTSVARFEETPAGVRVATHRGTFEARVALNAAGLHADRLARQLAPDLRIVPFRGYYAELVPARRHLVQSHVYGTPDLDFPFLGVHLSRRTDGRVIVGPGAMLAFGREAYRLFQVHPKDLAGTLAWRGFRRLWLQSSFRRLVRQELGRSLRLKGVADAAACLVPEVGPKDLVRSFAGNRAQVVDRDGRLVQDMVVRTTEHAVHVLNAVSPGLTASLPFGEHLADLALERL